MLISLSWLLFNSYLFVHLATSHWRCFVRAIISNYLLQLETSRHECHQHHQFTVGKSINPHPHAIQLLPSSEKIKNKRQENKLSFLTTNSSRHRGIYFNQSIKAHSCLTWFLSLPFKSQMFNPLMSNCLRSNPNTTMFSYPKYIYFFRFIFVFHLTNMLIIVYGEAWAILRAFLLSSCIN